MSILFAVLSLGSVVFAASTVVVGVDIHSSSAVQSIDRLPGTAFNPVPGVLRMSGSATDRFIIPRSARTGTAIPWTIPDALSLAT